MIDFDLGDELTLIQETAREFAQAELRPREREFERDRGVPPEVQSAFAAIGLAAVELPEDVGGAGLGALARCVVLEELGAGDPGAALALDPLGPALYALLELGGAEAVRELGAPLIDRPGARAVLVWEPETTLAIDRGTVSGRVPWVPADRIDLLVVVGRDGGFAVAEGIRADALRGSGLRAAGASSLELDAAPVRAAWSGAGPARRALARARLYAAGLLIGVLRIAADYSREYAMNRVAFGRPIAHHQALAFLIADMASAIDGARLLIHEAAWRLDSGGPAEEACATAFCEAVEASSFVAPNALQILGGHGFMQDYPVEKQMREARTLGLMFGGIDTAREQAGQDLILLDGPVPLDRVDC